MTAGISGSQNSDAVTTLPKAIGLRALVIFSPVVVLIIVLIATPGSKPWAIALLVAFALGNLVLLTASDRKLRVDLGKPDAPWGGNYAAWLPVEAEISTEAALRIAREAVQGLRSRQVRTIGDHTVVGWVGYLWTNVARWQAYELAVVVVSQPGKTTQMICCARPRFSIAYFGGARSRELAAGIQRAVSTRL